MDPKKRPVVIAAPSKTIFSLPQKIRNNIYEMILRVPHPLYLFQEPNSHVELFAPDKPDHWLSLLYVNRQMSSEASAVLYSTNKFSLLETTEREAALLQGFLHCIGSANAQAVSYLCISLPSPYVRSGPVQLREESTQILASLKGSCTCLKTVELVLHSKNCRELTEAEDQGLQVHEALSIADRGLRSISTLKRILVRTYTGMLPPSISRAVLDLGWIVLPGRRG